MVERRTDLSPRERQTLALLLEGLTDKEIAARLGISPYTVNQYTKSIYARFGADSRAGLLAQWLHRDAEHGEAGLIP
jgi:DNA-binding CsgD family transcriptional regulator